jgi:hypothetical protein
VINNLAPVVAPLSMQSYAPNSSFILSGTFTDAGMGDGHTVTIDWGDGTATTFDASTQAVDSNGDAVTVLAEPTATTSGTYQMGHVYSDTADHTVTVTVTDNGGLSSQVSRVYSTSPVLTSVTPPINPTVGVPFSGLVATFTKESRTAADFSATINWGDGFSSTVTGTDGGIIQNADGSYNVSAGHAYTSAANGLQFSVLVTDLTSGNQDSGTGTVNVLALPTTTPPVTPPSPSVIQGILVNQGTTQRSTVGQIKIVFKGIFTLARGAFQVFRAGHRVRFRVMQFVENGNTVIVLKFLAPDSPSGSLPDGNYRLVIRGDLIRDSQGQPVDVNGNGVAGGILVSRFFRLFGDTNGNGQIDGEDLALFRKAFAGGPEWRYLRGLFTPHNPDDARHLLAGLGQL